MTPNELKYRSVDPILEEIHETRRKLLQQHGGIAGLAEFLRRSESNVKNVIPEPARPNAASKSARPNRKQRDQSA